MTKQRAHSLQNGDFTLTICNRNTLSRLSMVNKRVCLCRNPPTHEHHSQHHQSFESQKRKIKKNMCRSFHPHKLYPPYPLLESIWFRLLHPSEPLMLHDATANPVTILRKHSPERNWKLWQINLPLFTGKSTSVLEGYWRHNVNHSEMPFISAYILNTEQHLYRWNYNFDNGFTRLSNCLSMKSGGMAHSERILKNWD